MGAIDFVRFGWGGGNCNQRLTVMVDSRLHLGMCRSDALGNATNYRGAR